MSKTNQKTGASVGGILNINIVGRYSTYPRKAWDVREKWCYESTMRVRSQLCELHMLLKTDNTWSRIVAMAHLIVLRHNYVVEARPIMTDNDILNQSLEFAMFRNPGKIQ